MKAYIKYCLKFFSLVILMLSATACSEEMPRVTEEKGDATTVSFIIPDTGFGSRAMNEENEGSISNLYVVAIKTYEYNYNETGSIVSYGPLENPQCVITSLNAVGTTFTVGDTQYKKFNVDIYPGKYRFLVLANIDLYLDRLSKVSSFTTEEDIRTILLDYAYDVPLIPGHLPMACIPSEIKYGENGPTSSTLDDTTNEYDKYVVDIQKDNNKNIYADLRFLCSKVRYTILFDNTETGISSAFKKNHIRFYVDESSKAYADNIRKFTKLYNSDNLVYGDRFNYGFLTKSSYQRPDEAVDLDNSDSNPASGSEESGNGTWTLDLDRYYYPGMENNGTTPRTDYPTGPSDKLTLWDKGLTEWMSEDNHRRAWQGIVYLPENNEEEGVCDRTFLNFPYMINNDLNKGGVKQIYLFNSTGVSNSTHTPVTDYDGNPVNSESTANHGLQRGMMYDVVARVKTPDELDVTVYVSVKPWEYEDIYQKW